MARNVSLICRPTSIVVKLPTETMKTLKAECNVEAINTSQSMDIIQLLLAVVVIFLAIYYYYQSKYNFWKSRGIPGPKPHLYIGNFIDVLTKKRAICTIVKDLYDEFKNEPVFGIYEGTRPVLVINDLDAIKDVLIRDFSVFVDRGFHVFTEDPTCKSGSNISLEEKESVNIDAEAVLQLSKVKTTIERSQDHFFASSIEDHTKDHLAKSQFLEADPLSQHLFLLEPERWRPLRVKLSPIFTSGKLKEMFPLVVECAGNLEKYLSKVTEDETPVECRDLAAKFTIDVIGSCVFGISTHALEDENSEFRKMGKRISTSSTKQRVREAIMQFMPSVYEVIGHFLQMKDIDSFFINLVRDTMRYRKENNVIRPDFIHMLMELKEHPEKVDSIELTDILLTAQAFVFFVAGFETSSSTIAHTLYELAQNHEIQDKLRREIRNVYSKNGENLTYTDIKGMSYLDKVFKETLRKYPILPTLNRRAIANYTFRDMKITIPKGTKIWIPVYGFHHDPNIYPDPEKFDPERFNDDVVAARHPMCFLPFGDGPRNCIAKVTTILRNGNILKNLSSSLNSKTLKFNSRWTKMHKISNARRDFAQADFRIKAARETHRHDPYRFSGPLVACHLPEWLPIESGRDPNGVSRNLQGKIGGKWN
ncbi:putative cytochrome P450 6a23 [Melipona quadrifasciata]|uniref:Putative cytochrome P450 6a23 n=1 Tax=Melipona quadrifasciata TaxID=166423 RepID=A0A0M9ADD6_9HYME|nr:putative cytochrome P450 6a23 [Melipona quadrifasciata]